MSHGIWSIVTHVIACCVVCDHRSLVNITSDGSFEVILGDEFFLFFLSISLSLNFHIRYFAYHCVV